MKTLEQMRAPWAERGAQFLGTTAAIEHFGALPKAEAKALSSGCGVGLDSETAILRLSGPDRVRFLGGQCTQQIQDRPAGTSDSAFVLEPKGKVVALLSFLIQEDDILLAMPRGTAEALQAWLAKFLMLSDAELEDVTSDYDVVRMAGPSAASLLPPDAALPNISFAIETLTLPTWLVLLPTDPAGQTAAFLNALESQAKSTNQSLVFAGESAFEIARIQHSVPRFGIDLDGTVLPSESGLSQLTVSLTKGCYCGQEVVARQHYLGKPRKALCHLAIECESEDKAEGLSAGLEILESDAADAKSIGTLRSVIAPPLAERAEGLAIIKGSEFEDGTTVVIASGDHGPRWQASLRRVAHTR